MAEAIGVASGIVGLAAFAFDASVSLYNKIQSFKSHPNIVRRLLEEVQALNGVLGPLKETIDATADTDFLQLDLPLRRCGTACIEFQKEIEKCFLRSGEDRTSIRDWLRIKYMGDDIEAFTRMLAGYKATINIALTHATLQKQSATAEILQNYKNLVNEATGDLEVHLAKIDEKLEAIIGQTIAKSGPEVVDLQVIEEERLSTEKCLQICHQLAEYIDQLQFASTQSSNSEKYIDPNTIPGKALNEGLQECKNSLAAAAVKLESYMREIMDRLVSKSRTAMQSSEDRADLMRLQEEWEATRQSISIFAKAETFLRENISVIDNYAVGNAIQFMVSTDGTIIRGSNRGLGFSTKQVGGHLSDTALQQLSRDMSGVIFRKPEGSGQQSPPPSDAIEKNKFAADYVDRYGPGFSL